MRKAKNIFMLFCMGLIYTLADAQQYNFKNYSTKNGLAGSIVNHAFQDSKGFIWFATTTGVSKFNGKIFTNYSTKDGLISNETTFITEDKNQNIWIATLIGVSKFDGKKFTNFGSEQGVSKGEVFCIYPDENNRVWLAINKGGVNIVANNEVKKISVEDGLPSSQIFSINQDKKGLFWFATGKGVISYDGKSFGKYDSIANYGNNLFFSTLRDSKSNVWFAGYSVLYYNGFELKKLSLPPGITGLISSICEDKQGNIWFATENGALKFSNGTFKLFTEKNGLSANFVLAIGRDYEGNIWITTQGGGVDLFNNEALTNYSDRQGLSSKVVNCITADKENKDYYIGTGTGINVLNHLEGSITQLKQMDVLGGAGINCIFRDSKDLLWIGTSMGVTVLQKKGNDFVVKKEYTTIDKRQINDVTKIIEDSKGGIWIVTQTSGVFRLMENLEKSYSQKTGFFSNNILTVYEDHSANIWFGTQDSGAIKFDGKKFKKYSIKEGFPDNQVWAIMEDENSNLFFGTGSSGLICYNGKKFLEYSVKEGLVSAFVNLLQWDKFDKCLWVGSAQGLNRIVFNQNLGIREIRSYGEHDGLRENEFIQNSSYIDKDGLIWFGSINGLTCYNRNYDYPKVIAPRLYLSEVQLD
jgi:ligand-binding sensor domain-containing protein